MGKLFGVDVVESKGIPRGTILFVDPDCAMGKSIHPSCNCTVVLISRWARFKHWLKKILK